jgi:muramoyltetrapeptide carboxypeptidase
MTSAAASLPLLKPRRLVPGMTIGVAAPSSPPDEPETFRFGLEVVESLGFKVKAAPHLFDRSGYLAGDDAARARDLNELFADESVDAVFCLRGGYGASRLLPLLDYDLIRSNPKVILGYSDITSLLLGIHRKTGLVTFHGPMATRGYSPYSLAELKKLLFNPEAPVPLAAPPPFERAEGRVEKENRIIRFSPGRARGPLFGGNLTLVAHLVGTPYLDEPLYSIDRMLTNLWLSGWLDRVAGVVFGKFTNVKVSEYRQDRTLEDVLGERMRALGIPCISGLMIGHVDDHATLPLGCQAELDADAGTLTLLEPAVC